MLLCCCGVMHFGVVLSYDDNKWRLFIDITWFVKESLSVKRLIGLSTPPRSAPHNSVKARGLRNRG